MGRTLKFATGPTREAARAGLQDAHDDESFLPLDTRANELEIEGCYNLAELRVRIDRDQQVQVECEARLAEPDAAYVARSKDQLDIQQSFVKRIEARLAELDGQHHTTRRRSTVADDLQHAVYHMQYLKNYGLADVARDRDIFRTRLAQTEQVVCSLNHLRTRLFLSKESFIAYTYY
jgi:hypothetical protein